MPDKIDFKLAFNGTTHRFASTLVGEQLLLAVKAKVASVVNKDAFNLFWSDVSSVLLHPIWTAKDMTAAVEYAVRTRNSSENTPCMNLFVTVSECAAQSHNLTVASEVGTTMTAEEKYRVGGAASPGMVSQATAFPPPFDWQGLVRKTVSVVDRLVGPVSAANPIEVMPARRAFFEKLVAFCEQHGTPIKDIPKVATCNVDLHRLYIAVRNKGGFEKVTRGNAWKTISSDANPELIDSFGVGDQLKRCYQDHLLQLEVQETGRNSAIPRNLRNRLMARKHI